MIATKNYSKLLYAIISSYRIKINNINFYIPYLTNDHTFGRYQVNGYSPYTKETPEVVQKKGNEYIEFLKDSGRDNEIGVNAEEMALSLQRAGLGIDCSGFVYRVLNRFLKEIKGNDEDLSRYLFMPRAEIIKNINSSDSWMKYKNVCIPNSELVSLENIYKLMPTRKPWHQANVTRIVSSPFIYKVKKLIDVKAGDLFYLKKGSNYHIEIVKMVNEHHIVKVGWNFSKSSAQGYDKIIIQLSGHGTRDVQDLHINADDFGFLRFSVLSN